MLKRPFTARSTYLVSQCVVKETMCDAKHWLSGETDWRKLWSKSPIYPYIFRRSLVGGGGWGAQSDFLLRI